MEYIAQEENTSVSKEALHAIALAAEGGMRDALSILDQTISYSDDEVELADVLAVTGGVSQRILTDIVTAMHKQDIQKGLELFDDIIQGGKDPGRFVYDLIYFLRDLLLYRSAPNLEDILERARVDEAFQQLADSVSEAWIQDSIIRMNECQQEIKWTNNPKVFIEIAIISITNRHTEENTENQSDVSSEDTAKLIHKMTQLEKEIATLKQAPIQRAESTPSKPRRRQTHKSKKIVIKYH